MNLLTGCLASFLCDSTLSQGGGTLSLREIRLCSLLVSLFASLPQQIAESWST